jgi:glutaredoxin
MYNIYGLKWCIFCLRAINFSHENGLEFHYYPMDDKKRILEYIKQTYNHKTVPIITIKTNDGEDLIGGYDDFIKHIKQQSNKKSNQEDS